MQNRNKKELSTLLDMDSYAGSQAITIKLPLALSNGSDMDNYERVDGEFEYEGTLYRMVKQKFYKDTVYIVCYKDQTTMALKTVIKDYVKSFTDRSTDKAEHQGSAYFIKDYLVAVKTELTSGDPGVVIEHFFPYHNTYKQFNCFSVDHPPAMIG